MNRKMTEKNSSWVLCWYWRPKSKRNMPGRCRDEACIRSSPTYNRDPVHQKI